LAGLQRCPDSVPLVFQYNKRDLEKSEIPLLSTETMDEDLNSVWESPFFPTSGLTGENVVAAMKQVVILALARFQASLTR
jgi:mutual gliding-motility protein MglA